MQKRDKKERNPKSTSIQMKSQDLGVENKATYRRNNQIQPCILLSQARQEKTKQFPI